MVQRVVWHGCSVRPLTEGRHGLRFRAPLRFGGGWRWVPGRCVLSGVPGGRYPGGGGGGAGVVRWCPCVGGLRRSMFMGLLGCFFRTVTCGGSFRCGACELAGGVRCGLLLLGRVFASLWVGWAYRAWTGWRSALVRRLV